jgi:hypothetical protein
VPLSWLNLSVETGAYCSAIGTKLALMFSITVVFFDRTVLVIPFINCAIGALPPLTQFPSAARNGCFGFCRFGVREARQQLRRRPVGAQIIPQLRPSSCTSISRILENTIVNRRSSAFPTYEMDNFSLPVAIYPQPAAYSVFYLFCIRGVPMAGFESTSGLFRPVPGRVGTVRI